MPTYEYRCAQGHEFEVFQRMSDEPVRVCPTCGAEAERLLSAGAGFLFKGEGFYITDYRSDDYRKRAKAESGEGAAAGKGDGGATSGKSESSGKGDAKPSSGGSTASDAKAPAGSGGKAGGGSDAGKGKG
jgi:putative FmdB family regulatory protein